MPHTRHGQNTDIANQDEANFNSNAATQSEVCAASEMMLIDADSSAEIEGMQNDRGRQLSKQSCAICVAYVATASRLLAAHLS